MLGSRRARARSNLHQSAGVSCGSLQQAPPPTLCPLPSLPSCLPLPQVRCVNTGLTARMRFKEAGLIFDKDPRQVGLFS